MLFLKEYKDVMGRFKHVPVDTERYIAKLSFYDRIHSDQKHNFDMKKLKNKNLIFHADVLAGCLSQLSNLKIVDDEIIKLGLHYSRDLLLQRSYKEINDISIFDSIDSNLRKVVLAVGCQTEEILENRVLAALKAYNLYPSKSVVIFSGKRPINRLAKIPDESARMQGTFIDQLDKFDDKQLIFHPLAIDKEGRSATTSENVNEVLERCMDVFRGERYNMFLASSTFHLARLSRDFEDALRKARRKKITLDKLILVPGEPYNKIVDICRTKEYLKQMFFGIYCDILRSMQKDHMMLKKRKRPKQNRNSPRGHP